MTQEIIQKICQLEAEAASVAETIRIGTQTLRDKQTALTKQANELRAQVIADMQANGVLKEELVDFVISLKRGSESVDIADEAAVPEEYLRIKKEVDKAKIKAVKPEGNWWVMRRGEDTLTIKGKNPS
jgi:uncharacterized protein YoaH (UPF0181 family)